MSLEGSGLILAVPELAVGGLVAGALLSGAALVALAGRGVVACGNAVREALERRAKQQQEILAMCRAYEKNIRDAAAASVRREDLSAQRVSSLLSEIRARRLPGVSVPTLAKPLEDEGLLTKVPNLTLADINVLRGQAEELRKAVETLQNEIDALRDGAWGVLVSQEEATQLRAETQALLEQLRMIDDSLRGTPAAGEEIPYSLAGVQGTLDALRREVIRLHREAVQRRERREEAIAVLEQAAKCLGGQDLAGIPDRAGLEVAFQCLETAQQALDRGDYEAAQAGGEAVLSLLQNLAGLPDRVRQANLEFALEKLDAFVAELGLPADSAEAALLENTRQALSCNDYDRAWEQLGALEQELVSLVKARAQAVQEQQKQWLAQTSAEVLAGMGYAAISIQNVGDEILVEAHQADGPAFYVKIDPAGLMHYRAEGHEGLKCQEQARSFFEGLRERGVLVESRTDLSILSAARLLREALVRSGYDTVKEQLTEGGIILTACKGERAEAVRLDYDGRTTPISFGGGTELQGRLIWQEKERQRLQAQWLQQLRNRTRRLRG